MNPVTAVNPDPWLQYGALGLLGLVLVGFAGFLAIGAQWAGKFLVRITNALERLPEAMGELKEEMAGTRARLDSLEDDIRDLPRNVSNEIQRKHTPQADTYVNKNPTVRIPRERLDTLISESERRPGQYSQTVPRKVPKR